jgi:hypothetical protein
VTITFRSGLEDPGRNLCAALRLLREYAEQIGLDHTFTIHDREDSADLMNLVLRRKICEFIYNALSCGTPHVARRCARRWSTYCDASARAPCRSKCMSVEAIRLPLGSKIVT